MNKIIVCHKVLVLRPGIQDMDVPASARLLSIEHGLEGIYVVFSYDPLTLDTYTWRFWLVEPNRAIDSSLIYLKTIIGIIQPHEYIVHIYLEDKWQRQSAREIM